ncbi:Uncharacterized protein SCF082_LOCUS38840 [Durusdinium trenchii]|uniref:Uncharacterized protein n=1 Tax=Durusdinium trenchii TaxID=1381693 RepID=A0ABP0Q1A1_9DINO
MFALGGKRFAEWTERTSFETRFFKFGPKTTSMLRPVEQMPLLTTQLEVLVFWSPLIPLLSLGIMSAVTANLLLFDLAVWRFGVKMPMDEMNQKATLSRSYLNWTLLSGSGFQLWHAFGSGMCGRYFLLAFHLAVLNPWATRFLPLQWARQHFWAEAEKAVVMESIELASQG